METSTKRPPKKQLTQEEKFMMRAKARRQFKCGVHRALTHLKWLTLDSEPVINTHDHNLFSYEDKCILMKPITERTKEDKDRLIKLISNTKMVKHYPMAVRNGLAGVTYLNCFGPERVLTKQYRTATEYYFLLDGKLRETYETMDTLLAEVVVEEKQILWPGHGFGDLNILNDTPRESTITTLTDVILLCVTKENFENVLENTVKKMWDEIKEQFRIIPYFQQYNQIEMSELLIISRLLYFEPDEILLGDQKGFKNFTYIILDGTCRMIENLLVIPHRTILSTTYSLYKPIIESESQSSGAGNITSQAGILYPSDMAYTLDKKTQSYIKTKKQPSNNHTTPSEVSKDTVLTFSESTSFRQQSKGTNQSLLNKLPPYVETHYMQLCTMKYGSTFNVGENLNNRRIVAITATKCLIVPKYWVLSHDKDRTWVSLCQLLNRHIPSTKQVFKEFKNQHKWLNYRKALQEDILSAHYYPSYNIVNNIPPFYRVQYQVPKD